MLNLMLYIHDRGRVYLGGHQRTGRRQRNEDDEERGCSECGLDAALSLLKRLRLAVQTDQDPNLDMGAVRTLFSLCYSHVRRPPSISKVNGSLKLTQ